MTETIREYFQRYNQGITQSVYSTMNIADFQRNKAYNEFLDFDRETLFRKNKQICGIRNIDNSCYLSVTLQLLYNIQSLREKIFSVTDSQSQFMIQLRKLFGMMYKGSLCYADPTNIYLVLKQAYPAVFVDGFQNDFHQVFTIVLEHIQKYLPTQDDKRFFKKIFYGKTKINLYDKKEGEFIKSSENSFNILSLPSSAKSFVKAIQDYKEQVIEGYEDSKGNKIDAKKQTQFIETPGLLTFLVNRVSYKDKKLVKDSSEFNFDDVIFFNKKNLQKSPKKHQNFEIIQKQEEDLTEWIKKIQKDKQVLQLTLQYLQSKQFEKLNVPTIENKTGEQSKEVTKLYIKAEIQEIQMKINNTKNDLERIQKKKEIIAEENYSELYSLWALMIHSGKSADSGHYKMCIKNKNNQWVQFNDRKVQEVSPAKIQQYSKKGEVCCLFYKRSNLVCYSETSQVPASLKKLVQDQEQKTIKKIDNARILQALYQESQSANIVWEFQNILVRQNANNYFFSPLRHLIINGSSTLTCKGYILYEMVSSPKFTSNIQEKLLDPSNVQFQIPKIDFGIPKQYWALSQSLKQFLDYEYTDAHPIEAFKSITFCMDIQVTNKITKKYFEQMRELVVLKGIFYESLLVEYNLFEVYSEFSKYVTQIIESMSPDSNFVLICITLRDQISEKYQKLRVNDDAEPKGCLINKKKGRISNYTEAFENRFQLQIRMRPYLIEKHGQIFGDFKKQYKEYIKEIPK